MTIALRRVTADDWETWRPVRLAALADAPGAFGSTLADWADAPEHRWRTRLSIPGALDLLAHAEDDSVVGMAGGVPGSVPGTAELISMWVDPAARGRGVAAALIRAVATWAARTGAHTLELSVMPDNTGARRTYERCGFTAAGDAGDPLPDGRHEIVMRRDLAAERTLDAYERAADRYAERTDDHRAGLVDDLLALVPLGARVLELGSGPGRDALALETTGLVVDRTDGARSFVDALRADGHDARQLDVRPDAFGGPYDAVFANAVLLHVERGDLGGVLARLRDAVHPGGVLAATVKLGEGEAWSTRKLDRARHFTYWTPEPLAEVVRRSGWTDVDVRETTRAGADERWLTVTARRPQGAGRP
ncbi:bifunctional GNAT family N-acetyltransferase/class I SAM-dependent methyltransferase [Curtobacterium sp. A7_M15]|uniref:bifunctional GNAT family N-acetyltransferase/class I SAM-dependent methyltransferase n=1 Tax=Curtobacterium sp. A7_M15 TaxID=3065241 RepID=UPI002737A3FE|nr:bifunctional GNAT family N-acetyltransferase/class I SAM-dependent methyltransferase [Curtobacterium sp. A7_M15]MDP4332775.1 bifunctional GNAT family N-acetyltransferase/class I SAM-dependent methyltransferase [Curtobacterium sp. A7_M15]